MTTTPTEFQPKSRYPGFGRPIIDMEGSEIQDLGAPTTDGSAATKKYVDDELAAAAVEAHPTYAIKADDVDPLLKVATISLTATEIKALNATPKQLIAAPGAGKTVIVERVLFRFTFVETQYTAGSALSVIYAGGSTNLLAGTLAATFITAPTDAVTSDAILAALGTQLAAPQDTAVQLKAASTEFDSGDGTMDVTVWYRVV